MKKLSVIMSVLLSTLFFITVFFSLGNQNFMTIIDTNAYFNTVDLSKGKAIQIYLKEEVASDEECQNFFYQLFKKYHAVAVGTAQYRGIELENTATYVYAETNIYEGQFESKDQVQIDYSSNTETSYYTSDPLNQQGALIDYLNPMFYNYSNVISYHPWHQAKNYRMPVLINVDGISVEEFQKEIKDTPWEKSLRDVKELDSYSIKNSVTEEGIQFDSYHLLSVSMGLSFASLLLMMIVEIVKHKKYVAVAQLNGISKTNIIKKKFSTYLLSIFCGFSVSQLLLLYFVSGPYRNINRELYQVIGLAIVGFFVLMLIVIAFLYGYLWMFCDFKDLKKKKMNLMSIRINIILKIILTVGLISPFVSLAKDSYHQMIRTVAMYQMKEESQHRYQVINNVESYQTQSDIEMIMKINQFVVQECHGKTFDFFDWMLHYHDAQKDGVKEEYEIPYVVVNRNYLKDYQIKNDENHKIIDTDALTKGVLLVPKRYENTASLQNYINQLHPSQTIWIEDLDRSLRPLKFSEVDEAGEYLNNPIIYLYDEQDEMSAYYMSDYYVDTDDLQGIEEKLKAQKLDQTIYFISMLPEIEREFNKQFITFTSMAFLFFGYLCVYLTFVFQSVFVYLDVYQKKLSIQYLQGYSYAKRYYEIYILNLCAYILAGIAVYMLYEIALTAILYYILFFGLIEILFIIYQIRRFERHSGLKALK